MRAAPGFNPKNSLFGKRSGNDEQALIFLRVNVVGDHHDVVPVTHRFTKHLHERRFPDPTGPPMPTRRGGLSFVRWFTIERAANIDFHAGQQEFQDAARKCGFHQARLPARVAQSQG